MVCENDMHGKNFSKEKNGVGKVCKLKMRKVAVFS